MFCYVADISQSTSFQGSLNTITVSVATRTPMKADYNDRLLVCNLIGPTTLSDPSLVVQDVGGTGANEAIAYTGSWTKQMFNVNYQPFKQGCLVLAPYRTTSKQTYAFSFELTNGFQGQFAPEISMHLFRTGRFSWTFVMDVIMTNAPGNAAPFLIQGFVETHGIQTLSSKSTPDNVINVTFEIRAALFPPNVIVFSNLLGAVPHTGNTGATSMPVVISRADAACADCVSYFGNASSAALSGHPGFAGWNTANTSWLAHGKATQLPSLNIWALKEVPPGQYRISFRILNPPTGQRAPAISAEINSAGKIVILRELITSAPSLDAPLAIFGYHFSRIGQSNASTMARNILTITLQPWTSLGFRAPPETSAFGTVMYPAAPQILISNLNGSSAPSGNMSLFERNSACGIPVCTSYFASHPGAAGVGQAIYSNAAKSLAYFVVRPTDNETFYTISFEVQNPPQGQPSPNITIRTWGYNYRDVEVLHLGQRNEAALLIGAFTVKSIRQKTDGRSVENTLTVTLVSNVDLFPASTIVISNLTETNTASNSALPTYGNGSSLFAFSGAWDKPSGTLRLKVVVPLLQNVVYVLKFDITNPDRFQLDPDVRIHVVGGQTPFPRVLMDSAESNAAPLFISGFPVAFLQQSNPLANQQNTLNFSFSTNNPMLGTDQSKFVITGIFNAITPSTSVPIISHNTDVISTFSDGQHVGRVMLKPDGNLTLFVSTAVMPYLVYNFWITVMNPAFDQDPGLIQIRGEGTSNLVDAHMQSPNAKIFGVVDGSNPLQVVRPAFDILVRQSRPIVNMSNTISIMMTPNTNIESSDSSYILLTGFSNAIAASTLALRPLQYEQPLNLPWHEARAMRQTYENSYNGPCVTGNGSVASGTPCVFPFEYSGRNFSHCVEEIPDERGNFWCSTTQLYSGQQGVCVCDASIFGVGGVSNLATFKNGILNLTLMPGTTMLTGLMYQFSFDVLNPAQSQAAASVSIQARGSALFEPADVRVPGQAVVGVLNGSDPMRVETPMFLVRSMAQTVPMAKYDTTLIVTLMSNVDLRSSDGSVITIAGLDGLQGPSSIRLHSPAGGNGGSELFGNGSSSSTSGTGAYVDGIMKLHLRQTMHAFVPYIIEFELVNPPGTLEKGPSVHLSASGTAKFTLQTFLFPNRVLYGVINGSNPLVRVETNFDTRDIFQTSPLADLLNSITVVLIPSINLGNIFCEVTDTDASCSFLSMDLCAFAHLKHTRSSSVLTPCLSRLV